MLNTSFTSIIKGKQSKLEENVDIDHGLLSKMEEYEVITYTHRIAIQVNGATIGRFCRLNDLFSELQSVIYSSS